MMCGAVVFLALIAPSVGNRASTDTSSMETTYEDFVFVHGSRGDAGSAEYAKRLALFEARRAEVAALNARPGVRWVAGLTRFADYTDEEFHGMLGYTRSSRWGQGRASSASSFLESQPHQKVVAKSMDWRTKLSVSAGFQRDQGGCGSCWAVAAVGALEMHAEVRNSPTKQLSFEQLVDCVPNPEHCGGDGGCKGATAELAFGYVHEHGLGLADNYKGYLSGGDTKCKETQSTVTSSGFVQLPINKYGPLLNAIATKGPVVLSVGAAGWSLYHGGVFHSCDKDVVVNHAVLGLGYGTDEKLGDYWLIRNSWGARWGEKGTIRLQRHLSDTGDEGHCGMDSKPLDGVFCKRPDTPAEVPVCGMCGMLSDSAYPTMVNITL